MALAFKSYPTATVGKTKLSKWVQANRVKPATYILTTANGKKICAGTYAKCRQFAFNDSSAQTLHIYVIENKTAINVISIPNPFPQN